tara:strand:+ start:222 stop:515 length:294 start_codon:yes stop_codon:yes gene_type:complete
MGTPFKMKGHTLPGPNQKKSPARDFGLISGPLTAMAIAKAAAVAAASAAASKGIGAISKAKADKKAEQAEAKGRRAQASNKTTAATSGDIGTKTKLV